MNKKVKVEITDLSEESWEGAGSYTRIREFDSLDEAKAYISYMQYEEYEGQNSLYANYRMRILP
jgi:hypothetical protein